MNDPSNKFSDLLHPLLSGSPSAKAKEEIEDLKSYLEVSKDFQTNREVDLIKEILLLLEKAIKVCQIYHSSHPTYQKFIELLRKRFEVCQTHMDPIVLRIEQFEIIFEDEVVYKNSDKNVSVAFKLFKDGITFLSFYKGLTQQEIIEFVGALALASRDESKSDDLLTLFWEKDFEHIAYQVIDHFIETELADNEEYKAFIEKLNSESGVDLKTLPPEDLRSDASTEIALEFGFSPEIFLQSSQDSSDWKKEELIPLTQSDLEEIKKIKEQITTETPLNLVYKMTAILFEILHLRKSLSEYKEILNVLEKIIEPLVAHGNFFSASEILQKLRREIIPLATQLSPEHLKLIQDVIDRIGNLQGINRVEMGLKFLHPDRLGWVLDFLTLLSPQAIPYLAGLLKKVRDSRVQKVLYEAILALGRENVSMLLTALETGALPITSEIISLILEQQKTTGENREEWVRLTHLTIHRDPKVRESLADALGKLPHPMSGSLLLKLLQDPDPGVRSRALTSLSRFHDDKIAAGLLKIIIQKDFNTKPFEEKKEFFKALGNQKSIKTIPILRKILQREEKWFNVGKYDEVRLGAALALGILGAQEGPMALAAREALKEGTQSRRKIVKEACEEILKKIGS
jgi:HEAT repeat protein